MKGLLHCPRCATSRYTVRVNDRCRCDGCGREADSLLAWGAPQLTDNDDSPYFTDPTKRAEVPEKVKGYRAALMAGYEAKETQSIEGVKARLAAHEQEAKDRNARWDAIEKRLQAIEKLLGI